MPLASRTGGPELDDSVPLDHQRYIEDTFVNKTSFNPKTYAEEFQLLQRYTSGSRISVTYFMRATTTSGLQRSDAIDPSSVRSPVQTSYTQIMNLEIVVQGKGLQSEFNNDNRETKITGEALLYPGMKPNLGDMFITPIGDAMYGVFQVMDTTRLTYRQGSNHRIVFFLREYATEEGVDIIRRSVTKTVWFDKETYLGDGTTLLKEDSYVCLKTLRQMRPLLIRHYYNTFFDKKLGSIASPDGVYDPYLVSYLTSKISIRESLVRPLQLYPGLQNYETSIWNRLTEDNNRTIVGLQADYNLTRYRVNRWDISITSLVNNLTIALDNPNHQAMEKRGWSISGTVMISGVDDSGNQISLGTITISGTGTVDGAGSITGSGTISGIPGATSAAGNWTVSGIYGNWKFVGSGIAPATWSISGSGSISETRQVSGNWSITDVGIVIGSGTVSGDPYSIYITGSNGGLPTTWTVDGSGITTEQYDPTDNTPPNRLGYLRTQGSLQHNTSNHGYVLSINFYLGDKTAMTPLEFLVYSVITERKILDVRDFIDCFLLKYTDLTYDEKYYSIPLYLWMIDVAIDRISAADAFMT